MKKGFIIKTYIIIFVSIIMIAFTTSLGYYSITNAYHPNIDSSIPDDDIFEDDTLGNEDSDNSQGENNSDTEIENKPVPIYTNGYDCVLDALELFDNCKGYSATTFLTATCPYVNQKYSEKIVHSGDSYFKETLSTADTLIGLNSFKYSYSTDGGKSIEHRNTFSFNGSLPDWGGTSVHVTVDKEELWEKYDLLAYNTLYIRPTKASVLTKFDRVSNDKYYIVSFKLNKSDVNTAIIDNIKESATLDSVTINSVEVTFYIEKTTLYIRKVTSTQSYDASKLFVSTTINVSQEFVFTVMNKEIEVTKPSYCL